MGTIATHFEKNQDRSWPMIYLSFPPVGRESADKGQEHDGGGICGGTRGIRMHDQEGRDGHWRPHMADGGKRNDQMGRRERTRVLFRQTGYYLQCADLWCLNHTFTHSNGS